MRLATTSIVGLFASLFFLTGCASDSDKPVDADADADTDSDADSDSDADVDTADSSSEILAIGYAGIATVTMDPPAYTDAIEILYADLYNFDGASLTPIETLCAYQWDIAETTDAVYDGALDSCADANGADCDFAFTIAASNGAIVDGTKCDNVFDLSGQETWGPYAYGYHPAFFDGTDDQGPALVFYDSTNLVWGVLSEAAYDSTAATQNFQYDGASLYYYN